MDFVFHIGAPKAGSSSIQRLMETEGAVTTEHRIHYPDISHHDLAQYLTAPNANPYRAQVWPLFQEVVESARANTDSVVVSSEFFAGGPPETLSALMEEHFPGERETTRVIHYLRPHAQFFLSFFVQFSKRGRDVADMDKQFEQFRDKQRLNFRRRVEAWEAVFGENYALRVLDRSRLKDGSITSDFLSFVCGEAPFEVVSEPQSNSSPTLEDMVFLRMVGNELRAVMGKKLPPELSGFMAYALTERMPNAKGTKVKLWRDLAERIRDLCAEDAAWLDAKLGGTSFADALDSAVEGALDGPQSLTFADHFDPGMERYAKVMAETIAELATVAGPPGPKRLRRKRLTEIRATIK